MVRLHLVWPFRDDKGELGHRFEQTLAVLRQSGFQSFYDGPRALDPARILELSSASSAKISRLDLTGLQHGRPRGGLQAVFHQRRPVHARDVDELRLELAFPISMDAVRRLMQTMVELWDPLWGYCGTADFPNAPHGGGDGTPVVGFITFLSNVYGVLPSTLTTLDAGGRGALIEAKCHGAFDSKNPAHKLAVTKVMGKLRDANLLLSLDDLMDHRIGWEDGQWRRGAKTLIQTRNEPVKEPAARSAEPMPAPAIATPTYLSARGGTLTLLEENPALGRTAPLDERRTPGPALPFQPSNQPRPPPSAPFEPSAELGGTMAVTDAREASTPLPFSSPLSGSSAGLAMSLDEYAGFTARCLLEPQKVPEIETHYGLSEGMRTLLDLRWRKRFDADPKKELEWKMRVGEAHQRLTAKRGA